MQLGLFDNNQDAQAPAESPSTELTVFCWNIANPSASRAAKQAEWLQRQHADVFVLTESKLSHGCLLLDRYFRSLGYNVAFPKPDGNEYGVLIISKPRMQKTAFSTKIDFLHARVASVSLPVSLGGIEVIGAYVPSRDSSVDKVERKKRFLVRLLDTFGESDLVPDRVFCGDLNILEPNHVPHYPFFMDWEYAFYERLSSFRLVDAFRHVHPKVQEYSWVGRKGDGYRYDHCFVSSSLLNRVCDCYYVHGPRANKLSDHSALVLKLTFQD